MHDRTEPTTPEEVRLRLMLSQRQREIERLRAGLREIMGTPGMPDAYYRNRAKSILEGRPDV